MSDYSKGFLEWREKNLEERVKYLEERKARLDKEVSQMEKPDCNRLLAEKLESNDSGCNCQRMVLVLVQDGEVKATEFISPLPMILRQAKTREERDPRYSERYFTKVGEAYYKEDADWHDYAEGDFDADMTHIHRYPKFLPTIQINGKHYYQEPCSYSDEATLDGFWDLEIENLPNGIYHVLWENACFTYYGPEGAEGDGDSDYKIYPSVPLYEFLTLKEQMLEEAAPEPEELADAYLYIQQTKQNRRIDSVPDDDIADLWVHSKSDDVETPNPLQTGTITPQQFADGTWSRRPGVHVVIDDTDPFVTRTRVTPLDEYGNPVIIQDEEDDDEDFD